LRIAIHPWVWAKPENNTNAIDKMINFFIKEFLVAKRYEKYFSFSLVFLNCFTG